MRRLRSWTLQEPQVEHREHQDDPDIHQQPLPEPVPEEQDIHADHDGYQHEHVERDACLSSLPSFLLPAAPRHYPSPRTLIPPPKGPPSPNRPARRASPGPRDYAAAAPDALAAGAG